MKIVIVATVFSVVSSLVGLAGPINEPTFEAISNYYARILPRLMPKGSPFEEDNGRPLTTNMVLNEEPPSLRGKIFNVCNNQPPMLVIVSRDSARIFLVWNHRLDKYVKTNGVQKAPALLIPEALSQAKQYLVDLEITLPANCVVENVSFNRDYPSKWEVRWVPTTGGYAYDKFSGIERQSIVIVFHEQYGFCGYGNTVTFPPPKTTEVKVSEEDAILKASKVAPLVMQTPFYRGARAGGFKITGVESAELRIAAPNWLLDPARAIWIRKKLPEETRLCWVVRLRTVDTVRRGDEVLEDVEILVYVDAATGEVVGANFT